MKEASKRRDLKRGVAIVKYELYTVAVIKKSI
jgi:hypothetical protein